MNIDIPNGKRFSDFVEVTDKQLTDNDLILVRSNDGTGIKKLSLKNLANRFFGGVVKSINGKQVKPGSNNVDLVPSDIGATKVNDSKINLEDTWSSKMINDISCIPFDRTGPIVSCTPVDGVSVGIMSDIELMQERPGENGSLGNPNNFKPWNKLKLYVSGKNLIPYPYHHDKITSSGVTIEVSDKGTLTFNGTLSSEPYPYIVTEKFVLPDGTYIYAADQTSDGTRAFLYKNEKLFYSYSKSDSPFTFTAKKTDVFSIEFVARIDGSRFNKDTIKPRIMLKDAPYEPLIGYTTEATPEKPVYGGKINWITKEIEETVAFVEFDGSEDEHWSIGAGKYFNAEVPVSNKTPAIGFCNSRAYKYDYSGDCVFVDGNYFYAGEAIVNGYSKNLSAWKEYLSTHPLQVCYYRKTNSVVKAAISKVPVVVSGENNIYSDSGDTTVTGLEAPKAALPAAVSAVYEKMDEVDAKATYATMMLEV